MIVLEHLSRSAIQSEIVLAALRGRVPSISVPTWLVQGGGLLAYGPDFVDVFDAGAGYVARILEGTRPQDLPVSEPTRYHVTLNRGTARAIGLTVPASLEARARQIID